MTEICREVHFLLEKGDWEAALLRWVKTVPPVSLATRLTALLIKVTPDSQHHFLENIIQNYHQQDEEQRWKIYEQAQEIGFDTPTGALGLSLFWSYGSLSPSGLQPVYPAPHLSLQMLHTAMIMYAVKFADSPVDGVSKLTGLKIDKEVTR